MNYYIHFGPVFQVGNKKLAGYNMFVSKRFEDVTKMDDVLTVECDDWKEYDRFRDMLETQYDPFDHVAFVDKHPRDILKYLRGEKETVRRTDNWESQIDEWTVNLRGERV